jgi:hypothetical protein
VLMSFLCETNRFLIAWVILFTPFIILGLGIMIRNHNARTITYPTAPLEVKKAQGAPYFLSGHKARTIIPYISMSALCALRVYNSLDKMITSLFKTVSLVYTAITHSLKKKTYILFENISTPYPIENVVFGSPSSAVPDWYYLPDTNTFVRWQVGKSVDELMFSAFYNKSLPVLSMDITLSDETLFDLTDFIGTVCVSSHLENDFPSVAHIIGAWSLTSGVVLDQSRPFNASMIDAAANMIQVSVQNFHYLSTEPDAQVAEDVGAVDSVTDAVQAESPVPDETT